jgi:hypothetical protein
MPPLQIYIKVSIMQVSVIRNVPMAVEYHNEDKIALRQKTQFAEACFYCNFTRKWNKCTPS